MDWANFLQLKKKNSSFSKLKLLLLSAKSNASSVERKEAHLIFFSQSEIQKIQELKNFLDIFFLTNSSRAFCDQVIFSSILNIMMILCIFGFF